MSYSVIFHIFHLCSCVSFSVSNPFSSFMLPYFHLRPSSVLPPFISLSLFLSFCLPHLWVLQIRVNRCYGCYLFSTWSGFHTNYPQALHSADAQPNWATLAALSALSTDIQTIPQTLWEGEWFLFGGCSTQADRENHSNTLMGIKTPITERASDLAAPFAAHMEGKNSLGRYHRTGHGDT